MSILHDLKIPIMVVPTAVAGVLLRLDVVAPVDLHERHAVLDQPSGQYQRLADARPAVAVQQRLRLLRQVVHPPRGRRSQHGERLGPVVVDGAGGGDRLGLTLRPVERFEEAAAVAEPFGREVVGQLEGRDARAVDWVVFQPKRIVPTSERAAALADDGFFALVQPTADHDERRQLRGAAADAGHDAARRRPDAAGQRPAVQSDAAAGAAGQADRPRDAVIARTGVERTHDGEAIAEFGDLRKQFADAQAGRFGGNRAERAANVERGVGLGVPGVEVRRPAP